jgi:MGT family glycosyltransferase
MEMQYSSGDLVDLASRTLEAVWPFFLRNKPDAILYDAIAIAGLIVAERLKIPSVRMSPQFALDETNLKLPIVRPNEREGFTRRRSQVTQYLKTLGVSRNDDVVYNRAVPTIYFYLPEFQLNGESGDGHCIYAGRCAAERPLGRTWRPPPVSRPLMLISTSTGWVKGIDYYRICLQASSDLNWHALLATGRDVDRAALEPLPPHCEVVDDVPQLLLMPHVEMILCLGGMATTMESIYHGLPMLMMSNGYSEAEMYADNVQRHGLGIHLQSAATTVENVRSSIVQISNDPTLRKRVNEKQKKVKRSPGGEEVINWVEDFLENPQYHFFASSPLPTLP